MAALLHSGVDNLTAFASFCSEIALGKCFWFDPLSSPLLCSALYYKGSVPNSLSHDLFKLQPLISDPDLLLVRARTDPTVQLSGFFLTDLDV